MSIDKDTVKLIALCFIIGAVIGNSIAWMISLGYGAAAVVAPEFVDEMGEPLAIVIQTLLCGLMGVFGLAGSRIYNSDRFGILQATAMHACLIIPFVMLTDYICWWTGRSVDGTLVFGGVMVMVYITIWITMYISYRAQVKQINQLLEERRSDRGE